MNGKWLILQYKSLRINCNLKQSRKLCFPLTPWRVSSFRDRTSQLTTGHMSICSQRQVNDHLASLG